MFKQLKCEECSTDRKAIKTLEEKIYTHHKAENKRFRRILDIVTVSLVLLVVSFCLYAIYTLNSIPVTK